MAKWVWYALLGWLSQRATFLTALNCQFSYSMLKLAYSHWLLIHTQCLPPAWWKLAHIRRHSYDRNDTGPLSGLHYPSDISISSSGAGSGIASSAGSLLPSITAHTIGHISTKFTRSQTLPHIAALAQHPSSLAQAACFQMVAATTWWESLGVAASCAQWCLSCA